MTEQPSDPSADALDPEQARRDPRSAVDELEERILGGQDRRLEDGRPGDVGPGEDESDTAEKDDGAVFELDLDPEDQGRADSVGPAPE